jgi:NAD(P)-dependent dehydrogenase (short-subunit alcohol dehydrogenase family)
MDVRGLRGVESRRMANIGGLSNKVAIVTGASKEHRRWDCNGLRSCGRARGRQLFLRPGRRRTRRSVDHRQRGRGDRGRGRRVQGRGCRAVIQRSAFRVRKTGRFGQQRRDIPLGAFAEITEESFHLDYNINVLGAILTVQEAIKRFGADGGSIINLSSSIVGSYPVPGALLYASTKGAIETLTRGLALELAPRKIRVNANAPGHTETEGNLAAGTFEGGAGAVLHWKTPLGRLGRVNSVRRISMDHRRGHSCRRRPRCGHLSAMC